MRGRITLLLCSFVLCHATLRGDWVQVGSDIGNYPDADQSLVSTVSLSSDGLTVAIGYRDPSDPENVRIYSYDTDSSTWSQMGSDIDGESADDKSGWSVSLSSDGLTVAIGAQGNDGNGTNSGHVRIYSYDADSSTWSQMGSDIDGESAEDESGSSVSLSSDGLTVAIGAQGNDGNGTNSGHVRIYSYDSDSSTWTQVGSDIDGESTDDESGYSVSLSSDGSTVAIGAPYNDDNESLDFWGNITFYILGHVRIYSYDADSSTWSQMGSDI
jgi:hypothetical protein